MVTRRRSTSAQILIPVIPQHEQRRHHLWHNVLLPVIHLRGFPLRHENRPDDVPLSYRRGSGGLGPGHQQPRGYPRLLVRLQRNRTHRGLGPECCVHTLLRRGNPQIPTVSNKLVFNDNNVIVISNISTGERTSYMVPTPGVRLDLAGLVENLPSGQNLAYTFGINNHGDMFGFGDQGSFLLVRR